MPGRNLVTREALVAQLHSLGIGHGDILLCHSSLKSIGHLEPGPEAAIEAMLEVLGPKGTLVVPTIIPAQRGIRPLFDLIGSPSEAAATSGL